MIVGLACRSGIGAFGIGVLKWDWRTELRLAAAGGVTGMPKWDWRAEVLWVNARLWDCRV